MPQEFSAAWQIFLILVSELVASNSARSFSTSRRAHPARAAMRARLPPPSRRKNSFTMFFQLGEIVIFGQQLAPIQRRHAGFGHYISFKIQKHARCHATSCPAPYPTGTGSDFKNQMCATGEASSIWPMRSRRTLDKVTSTPHFSQITPRCFSRFVLARTGTHSPWSDQISSRRTNHPAPV